MGTGAPRLLGLVHKERPATLAARVDEKQAKPSAFSRLSLHFACSEHMVREELVEVGSKTGGGVGGTNSSKTPSPPLLFAKIISVILSWVRGVDVGCTAGLGGLCPAQGHILGVWPSPAHPGHQQQQRHLDPSQVWARGGPCSLRPGAPCFLSFLKKHKPRKIHVLYDREIKKYLMFPPKDSIFCTL